MKILQTGKVFLITLEDTEAKISPTLKKNLNEFMDERSRSIEFGRENMDRDITIFAHTIRSTDSSICFRG